MKQMKRNFLAAACLLLLHLSYAQSDSANTPARFKLSINYNNRLNYYGRTDSLKSSGIFPTAEWWFSPKFYVNASPVFVNNSIQRFAYEGTVTTLGYQNITSHWITGVYVLKPFYKANSELVQSALKAQSGMSLSYQNAVVNVSGGADVKLSDKVDYGATASLDHVIRLANADKSVIVIDPTASLYAGTQNFQRTYYKKNNSKLLLFPSSSQQVTEEVSRFNVLAYEVSIPLVYAKDKWMFLATPSYMLPQNLVTVAGRPDLSERGENLFYATLTAKYSF